MSKLFSDGVLVTFATGINTIAIAGIKFCGLDPAPETSLLAMSPFLSNTLVFAADWLFAKNNVKSAAHIRMEEQIESQIKAAKQNLEEAQKHHLDMKPFQDRLSKLMQARTNIPALAQAAKSQSRRKT